MVYQLSRGGQSYGPYSIDDLRRYLAAGNVLSTDLVKTESETDWVTVAQLLKGSAAAPSILESLRAAGRPAAETMPEERFPLFPVSKMKFIVMSVCTLGFYQLYWAYKNWARIKAAGDESIMPLARAIFAGIWNFSLFDTVNIRASYEEIPARWSPVFLGMSVIAFGLSSYLTHGLGAISLLSFLPYLPVVGAIESLNRKQAAITAETLNDKFSEANIAGIVIGGLVTLLAIVGWMTQAAKALK